MVDIIHKDNSHPTLRGKRNLSERWADELTEVVGSWGFIIALGVFLIAWIILNIFLLEQTRWDPYPFILLNLALSFIAAFQAPIILMSQNRAAQRDRTFAKYDYQVNRKAEREIANMQRDLDEIKAYLKRRKR